MIAQRHGNRRDVDAGSFGDISHGNTIIHGKGIKTGGGGDKGGMAGKGQGYSAGLKIDRMGRLHEKFKRLGKKKEYLICHPRQRKKEVKGYCAIMRATDRFQPLRSGF